MSKMYRFQDTLYSSGDDEYGYHTHQRIHLLDYDVVKYTPHGVWVGLFDGKPFRFVKNGTRKRFAWETKELALISFRKRKESQIKKLREQLKYAEEALSYANHMEVSSDK
jgi:hypothetical protein